MSAGTASGIVARGVIAAARSLPTLLTATEWWTQTVIASGAMTGQLGSGMDLQLGSTSGADANDPTVADGTAHRYLAFDGSNDYCQIPLPAGNALDVGADVDFTIVTIVRHSGSAEAQIVFEKGHGSLAGYRLLLSSSGAARMALRDTDLVNFTVDSAALSTGVDYIVAGRREGSTLSVIVDGAAVDAAATNASATNTDGVPFLGATGAPAGGLPLNGRTYGQAIWIGTALTDDQTVAAGKELLAVAHL